MTASRQIASSSPSLIRRTSGRMLTLTTKATAPSVSLLATSRPSDGQWRLTSLLSTHALRLMTLWASWPPVAP
uniref:SsDNA binding protein n=1 Tax=uncultured marine virus TaxID=186617 RepID=A0A0F7LAH6_9VIRU|nr:ssDNA binding protein [uncultured marine virus]